MTLEITTKNSRETQKVAALLARHFLEERISLFSGAVVLAFQGDLGSGKTTFIQGFAKELGVKEKILSPTFVILKIFKITKTKNKKEKRRKGVIQNFKYQYLYHLDCYRIDNPQEIIDLNFKEIIQKPENIVVIEWAEKIKKLLPKSAIWLNFEWIDKNKRKIRIKSLS